MFFLFIFSYFLGGVWGYVLIGGSVLFLKLLNTKENILSLLLVLEMVMLLNMLILISVIAEASSSFCFLFVFLTCAVCESCMGISIMIHVSREIGSAMLELVK